MIAPTWMTRTFLDQLWGQATSGGIGQPWVTHFIGSWGGAWSKAQGLRSEDMTFLKGKLGLAIKREKIYSRQRKNHKHATATCSNILKTLHRPNKAGLLAEGGLSTSSSNSPFSICFLGDLIQDWAFIYHRYTKNATFSSLTHKFNCLLTIFTWMPQTHLQFNLSKMKLMTVWPSTPSHPKQEFLLQGRGWVRGDKTKVTEVLLKEKTIRKSNVRLHWNSFVTSNIQERHLIS